MIETDTYWSSYHQNRIMKNDDATSSAVILRIERIRSKNTPLQGFSAETVRGDPKKHGSARCLSVSVMIHSVQESSGPGHDTFHESLLPTLRPQYNENLI